MATQYIKISEAARQFPQLGHERIRQLAASNPPKIAAQRGEDGGWLVDPASIATYIRQPKRPGGRPRKDQGAPTGPQARPQDMEAAGWAGDNPPIADPAPVVGDPFTGDPRPAETGAPSPEQRIILGIMGAIARKLGATYFHVTGDSTIRGNWFAPNGRGLVDTPRRPATAPLLGVPVDIPGPLGDGPQDCEKWRRSILLLLEDTQYNFVAWLEAQQTHGFDVMGAVRAVVAARTQQDMIETTVLVGTGFATERLEAQLAPPERAAELHRRVNRSGEAIPVAVDGAPDLQHRPGIQSNAGRNVVYHPPPAPDPAPLVDGVAAMLQGDPIVDEIAARRLQAATAAPAPPAGVWQLGDQTRCSCPGCGHARMSKHHYQNGRRRCPTCIVADCQPGAPRCANVPTEDLLGGEEGDIL